MSARPNLFQASMLRWRALHPYCAGHALAIAAPLDAEQLERVIASVLEECGLTGLVLHPSKRFGFEGGAAQVELSVVEGEPEPFEVAARLMEASINQPFPASGAFDPFRFTAIRAADGFVLMLVYDHFVAGGDSIVVLVTDIADRYLTGLAGAPRLPRVARDAPGYARLFARQGASFARGLSTLPALLGAWRRAIRPRLADPSDGRNGVAHFLVPAPACDRMRSLSRELGITQNDLWLALTLRAVFPIARQRSHTGRRHLVALASIVNLRRDYQPPATEAFGQFLSSFRVVHPIAAEASIAALAGAIALQTRLAKERKLYLVTLIAMGAAAMLWPFAGPERRARLYIKYHPVFAGLTPLNVNALRRRGVGRDGDYFRVASTGPMAPMVLSITTSGSALRVGITYRTTALTSDEIQRVVRSLLDDLRSL